MRRLSLLSVLYTVWTMTQRAFIFVSFALDMLKCLFFSLCGAINTNLVTNDRYFSWARQTINVIAVAKSRPHIRVCLFFSRHARNTFCAALRCIQTEHTGVFVVAQLSLGSQNGQYRRIFLFSFYTLYTTCTIQTVEAHYSGVGYSTMAVIPAEITGTHS